MTSTTHLRASRTFTVRLEPDVRDRLDALARTSDRSIAQLTRYALTSYFAGSDVPANPGEDTASMKHTTVRLPISLADQVDLAASRMDSTPSAVIRSALAVWLNAADLSTLGAPAVTIGGTR